MEGEETLERQFNKLFELSINETFELPSREKWYQSSSASPEAFGQMRDELNSVKSLLNQMPLSEWHKHTRNQNPAGFVTTAVRKRANPELLTQAWCKFTEILWRFPNLVSENSESLASFHLCEAPGAFITTLNNFVKLNRTDLEWSWTASTLNPYHEGNSTGNMINDDRFILHTLNHWTFGIDQSGDLLKPVNLKHFIEKYGQKIDLVTADGSIDCQTDPARQETLVTKLHYGEIIAALGILRKGGNFVLKMFTFYEMETICHVYLLTCVFEKVTVFKPATSKEGNSEVYVICEGFKGVDNETLESLIDGLLKEENLFALADINDQFLSKIEDCARYFMDIQTSVIKRNIESFSDKSNKEAQKIKTDEKKLVSRKFIEDFNIQYLDESEHVVQNKVSSYVDDCRQADERVEFGTFQDKCTEKSQEQKLQLLQNNLNKLYPSWLPVCRKVEWVPVSSLTPIPEFQALNGAPFNKIQSSKFCPCRAIKLYQEARQFKDALTPCKTMAMKKRKLDLIKFNPIQAVLPTSPILSSIAKIYPEVLTIPTFVIKAPSHDILDNSKTVADVIEKLIETLNEMKRGQHLIILNMMLLTRLQVVILFILLPSFEEIGFLRPTKDSHGIFLSEFKGEETKSKVLLEEMNEILNQNKTLLSIVPVEYLTQEPIYSMIVAHNMNIMRETSQALLKT